MKWILIIFAIMLLVSIVSASTPPIIYVDTDGSGDYNCDGTDDHVQINQALAFVGSNASYTTVHLNGTNTYWINATLNMYEDTIFEGDSDAEIKLIDEAGWGTYTPIISNTTAGSNNFTIRGFEIDGNSENQSVSRGVGYYNLMFFRNCYNVTVDNMRLEWSTGDGLKVSFTGAHVGNKAFVTFTNNSVYKLGHDALYVIRLNNVTAAHNDIQTRTNSGIRLTDSGNGTIYNNTIYSILVTGGSTGPGIQFDKNDGTVVENIEVYNNTIHTMVSSGMWITGFDNDDVIRTGNIYIHHNTFYNVGQRDTDPHGYQSAAITIGQFNDILIENNVIDDSGLAGIKSNIYYGEYHMDASFTNTIRNNIITNNEVGIWNDGDNTHSFISDHNCLYDNNGGNYNGTNITYSNDIYVDPLFVLISNHDYHLKSNAGSWNPITSSWNTYPVHSPCIDAGNESSYYNDEPYPNGGRINIGVYGDTVYASKSDTVLSVDNIIKSNTPNSVWSNAPNLDAGQRYDNTDRFRSWIWFDLSSYAQTEIIDSAVLNMTWYYNTAARNQSTNVGIYFPNVTVDTNYLSWNNSSDGILWKNPGGDWFDANNVSMGNTPFDNVTFPNTSPDMTRHSWNLTTLVQSIVNGSRTNNGFFIIADEITSNYIAFSSLDNETEADRPTLTITASNYTRIEFIAPTLTNNSVTNENYVEINTSIELESMTLDSFTWNWNSINTTFLNNSCVLHMSFDNNSEIGENSTVVVDVSQYGNNGSFENGVTGTWTTDGHNRGAMSFVPGDSVVISPSQNIDDDQLTVTAWINPSVNPDVKGMIYYKSGGWYFELDNTGELEVYLYDTTNVGYHKMSISVPLTVWSFVAFTYNGTNETVYLNDAYEMWANTGNIVSTTPAYIGGQDGNSRNYTGMIDELREYRCWYSHEEIEQMRLSNLYKFNSTQWYFSSNQTNLSEGEYNYQIFANDIESDYRVVTYDITPPTYNNVGHSSTEAGASMTFSIQYNDDVALNPNGQYIFSTNNTGVWVNDSIVNWTTTPQYSNVVKTLNSTNGTIVGYRWYASDTGGNINNTPIYTLIVQKTIATITIPANTWAMFNNWISQTTFAAIAANELNDVCYTHYNVTSGLWKSYYVGYLWNNDYQLSKDASVIGYFNAQTDITSSIITPSSTELYAGWNMLGVQSSSNQTISGIIADIGANCSDSWYFNSSTGSYSNTTTHSIQPNQGFLAYITQNMTWTRSTM